jgi:hypothetical protein
VHLATICYVLGLLTRNELLLQYFVIAGSIFYILYYYFIADAPLWEAIGASVLIGLANLPVIYLIFRERSTLGMSEKMLTLYRSFPIFNHGQFRKMMKRAHIVEASEQTPLLQQNVMLTHLYLTITDGFFLARDTQNAALGPGNFLDEISFLSDGAATATVVAKPGSSDVEWELSALRYMMNSSPTMTSAISVSLNKDIARKLAVSFPSAPQSMIPANLT